MTEKWGRSGLLVFGHEANWTALVKRHYAGMEPSDQGLEAVAKLMQAAPEMREALEKIQGIVGPHFFEYAGNAEALEAIAKTVNEILGAVGGTCPALQTTDHPR